MYLLSSIHVFTICGMISPAVFPGGSTRAVLLVDIFGKTSSCCCLRLLFVLESWRNIIVNTITGRAFAAPVLRFHVFLALK